MNSNKNKSSLIDLQISTRRKLTKYFMIGLMLIMTFAVIFPLFWILYEIFSLGLPIILDSFPNFFVKTTRPPRDPTAGVYNAIYGSILSVLVATIVGVPIGLLSGIYLGETKNNKYTETVRFIANVLSGTPSIVAGLVIYTFYVRPLRDDGYGALGAGLALAILMLPTITRVTEDGIRTVPSVYREAGLALGIPKYRVTLSIVLRASLPIVMTGIMLGVARIAGETAPLLFTAGDTNFLPRFGHELNDPTATLPVKIFNYSLSAFPNWIAASWGMAFFLVSSILILNLIARTSLISSCKRFLKRRNKYVKKSIKILFIGLMLFLILFFLNTPVYLIIRELLGILIFK